jgi:hypothetical protein
MKLVRNGARQADDAPLGIRRNQLLLASTARTPKSIRNLPPRNRVPPTLRHVATTGDELTEIGRHMAGKFLIRVFNMEVQNGSGY